MPLESQYSTQVSAMASDVLLPAKVLNLIYEVSQGQVVLSWDPVTTNNDGSAITDLGGYHIYRKNELEDSFDLIGTVDENTTSFTDNAVIDGANLYYAVAAFDDEASPNEGALSDTLAVKTIPSIPQNLNAIGGDSVITLTWDSVKDAENPKLNENLAGYNVYRSETDGTGYILIGSASAEETSFEDLSVENNVTYYYVITAFDNSN